MRGKLLPSSEGDLSPASVPGPKSHAMCLSGNFHAPLFREHSDSCHMDHYPRMCIQQGKRPHPG